VVSTVSVLDLLPQGREYALVRAIRLSMSKRRRWRQALTSELVDLDKALQHAGTRATLEPRETNSTADLALTARRVTVQLLLELLDAEETAFQRAVDDLVTASTSFNAANATIESAVHAFQQNARTAHLAALLADRASETAYNVGVQANANLTHLLAGDAAAAAAGVEDEWLRRGNDILESVGRAADAIEAQLQEDSTTCVKLKERPILR